MYVSHLLVNLYAHIICVYDTRLCICIYKYINVLYSYIYLYTTCICICINIEKLK